MNPEFERNLWLEATPRRLTGLSVALGLIFAGAWLVARADRHMLQVAMAFVGMAVFAACGVIWAARAAGGSVLEEIRARTWDFQRLSALTPWAMTWGKLFGAGSLAWLGAAAGLTIGGAALSGLGDPHDVGLLVLGLIALALFLQACAMGAALVGVRKARAEGRMATGGAVLLGVVGGLILLGGLANHLPVRGQSWTGGGLDLFNHHPVSFYGALLPGLDFASLSLCLFAGWALIGAWRLMRLELQAHNSPWIWLAFLIFVAAWRAGLAPVEGGLPAQVLTAGAVFAALAYAAAFVEPVDPLRLRRFAAAAADGDLSRMAALAPAAAFPLALALACGLAAMVIPRPVFADTPLPTSVVAVMVFVVRDLAVIAIFRYGPRPGRGDLSAVIALELLYGVGGNIDRTLGQGLGVNLFTPLGSFAPLAALVSGVVQAAAAGVIAGQVVLAPPARRPAEA